MQRVQEPRSYPREDERAERIELRRRSRSRSHTLAGAVLFAGAQLVFGLLALNPVAGVIGAVILAPLGALAGFLASRGHWGIGQAGLGGFAIAGVFFAITLGVAPLMLPTVVLNAALAGGIPGCLLGFHVTHDV